MFGAGWFVVGLTAAPRRLSLNSPANAENFHIYGSLHFVTRLSGQSLFRRANCRPYFAYVTDVMKPLLCGFPAPNLEQPEIGLSIGVFLEA